ncbi:PPOX class F420-dependent oxidoreductase [Mangrovihabitans endophyticus]|nr:PPOX class F420-dependent oxidoreductase [Mangrovihabitans endophyticus]
MNAEKLGAQRFVSLTTYRRDGTPVPTPVWVARDDEALLVTTPADTGKVKRLRRDPRVRMQPSTRGGKVAPDAPALTGTAQIIDQDAGAARLTDLFRRKYGLEYRIFSTVERIVARGRRPRVLLRITPDQA